jgi:hypothetical protein
LFGLLEILRMMGLFFPPDAVSTDGKNKRGQLLPYPRPALYPVSAAVSIPYSGKTIGLPFAWFLAAWHGK